MKRAKSIFFVGYASGASGGGAASLVSLKKGSRKVYNYSTNIKFQQTGRFVE